MADSVFSSSYLSDQYGTRPVGPPAVSTAPAAVGGAMTLGQQAYSQLPNYQSSLGNIGANINSLTAGVVPDDVARQIAQGAAERGISMGAPGSANSNAALLHALGLTSLQLQNEGQQQFQSILPMLPGASISQNPAFYPTTAQDYEANLQSNIFKAAPLPAAAAGAAMGAARSGFNAGLGSTARAAGLPATPTFPEADDAFYTAPQVVAGSTGTGSYYGGQYLTEPPSTQAVNQILQDYSPPAWNGLYGYSQSQGGFVPTTGGGWSPQDWNDFIIGASDE